MDIKNTIYNINRSTSKTKSSKLKKFLVNICYVKEENELVDFYSNNF